MALEAQYIFEIYVTGYLQIMKSLPFNGDDAKLLSLT